MVGFHDLPREILESDAWQKAADEDERAQVIACAVIEDYGLLEPHEWEKFRKDGKIWRDQCQAAGVPFFFKQWGEWVSSHALPIEIVGTREQACVLPDGRVREWQPGYPDARLTDPQMHPMTRVGKKATGALLDGREWKEFPA